jgi:hypothetical protein
MIICHRFSNANKAVGGHFVSFQVQASSFTLVTRTIHKSTDCTCLLRWRTFLSGGSPKLLSVWHPNLISKRWSSQCKSREKNLPTSWRQASYPHVKKVIKLNKISNISQSITYHCGPFEWYLSVLGYPKNMFSFHSKRALYGDFISSLAIMSGELHVNCLLFLPDFQQIWSFSKHYHKRPQYYILWKSALINADRMTNMKTVFSAFRN